MRLILLNVERETDNEREIRELKEEGYTEVKNERRTKAKSNGKTPKQNK